MLCSRSCSRSLGFDDANQCPPSVALARDTFPLKGGQVWLDGFEAHMNSDVVISVRGLRNQFGTQVIHNNLDLDIFGGEVLGIVGGSGTGKSVLLRTILGINKPAAGRIQIFGKARGEMTSEEEQ